MDDWPNTLKALADECRLKIIRVLLNKEASVQELSDSLNVRCYNISKHLKILEMNKLVTKRKDGAQRIYALSSTLKHRLSGDEKVLDLGCCQFIFGNSKARND